MKKIVMLGTLMCVAGAAQAVDSPQWNRVAVSYESIDLDGATLTGLGLHGSKLLAENVFLTASYADLSDDIQVMGGSVDLDASVFSVGLGYRHAVAPNTDLFGVVSYEDAELGFSGMGESDEASDNGYGLTAGVRSLVTESLELGAQIRHVDVGGSDTSFGVSGQYYFNERFALGAGYSKSDDADTTSLRASFYF